MVSPLAFFSGFSRDGNAAAGSFGIPVRRNKLIKRQQLRKSHSHVGNTTANEIQAEMGNHISFENIPRPTRQPRSAPCRVPSLPCLPIYETFTVAHIEAALREEKLAAERADPAASSQRHRSSRNRPQRDIFPAIKPGERPPAYDRALHLAESYQSILPNYDVMDQDDEEQRALRRQRSEHNLRRPRQYVGSLTSCGDRRDIRSGVLSSARHGDPVTPPPVPPPKARARSMATPCLDSSSATVHRNRIPVEDATLMIPRRSETIPEEQADQPSGTRHSIDQTAADEPRNEESKTFAAQAGELPPSADDTSASLALQICSKLLTAELAKVLVGPDSGEDEERSHTRAAAKLQILMMIEAYEGLMEHWKDVISKTPSQAGASSDDGRVKCGQDAVAILTHWLSSLHTLYQDTFEDQ